MKQRILGGIPTIALRGMTVFPEAIVHFDISRERSLAAVEQSMPEEGLVFLLTQRDPETENPGQEDVYPIGCLARIKQISKLPEQIVRVMVEVEERIRLEKFIRLDPCICAEAEVVTDDYGSIGETEIEAMRRNIQELFQEYASFYPRVGKTLQKQMGNEQKLGFFLDRVAESLPVSFVKKQQILSAVNVGERFELLAKILMEETEIAGIRNQMVEKVRERVDRNQKEYILREQMRYIREELGEEDDLTDTEQFEEALKGLQASKEVKDKIQKQIRRFRSLNGNSAESSVERSYIEALLELPWDKSSKDKNDVNEAEAILNRDHYGLEKVKKRVLEFLSVRSLTQGGTSPILCLVGPPGTGKTSVARSVAEALNKKYVRICLGGVRDEAEIRGHRRTYIGSMPGRIIEGLKQAGVKNPLMLLDEIDKVGSDARGDTASALLEVLDGEQNSHFRDHYIELPVDLSEVLFIATANSTETIPRPLLDRMELIEVESYTANEKFHIAKEHLLPRQLKVNGMDQGRLEVSDSALRGVIEGYTREAGVRSLERRLGELCRKAARERMQKGRERVRITERNLGKYLGERRRRINMANEKPEVGIVRGLAWTSVGGDTLQIEVNKMPGKGNLKLTGQMGDVMKESAQIALSYVRSVGESYGLSPEAFEKQDFHLHIPEGAVPKDGPSAGITMATALLSALTELPVRADLAMTGEITLRGRVLPIGGLKEKTLAAKTAGIHTVLVPKENETDVKEIAPEIRSGLEIIPVESMEEVIRHAFVKQENRYGN